jgi:lipoprotein-anchoring transpeptidase ErfK/SrfK
MKAFIALSAAALFAATLAVAPASASKTKTNFGTVEETAPKQKRKKIAIVKRKTAKPKVAEQKRRGTVKICTNFFQCMFSSSGTTTTTRRTSNSRAIFGGSTRSTVAFSGKYAPGTIIVRTPERALYLVQGGGKAIRYRVGVGREGFQWSGSSRIVSKQEWPDWRPPATMIAREAAKGHIIPEFMEGGPGNPLGARAMYIGGTLFRIHGTNNPSSIGGAVSSGCIRMMNNDVVDLYGRVRVGTRVIVTQ